MKVLVTGGAGFLGSRLCEKLLEKGRSVICIDDLSTGKISNIERLIENKNFEFHRHNIVNTFPDFDAEEIFNLASPASPKVYMENRLQTLKASTQGVINALEFARAKKAKILQASTSEIYGEAFEHPQSESYNGNVSPTGPRSCYAEGKRCAEALFKTYALEYGMDAKIARIFNTFGPRMGANDGRVISNFISAAMTGEDLVIYGDGKQTRTFCFVDDMVNGLIRLMGSRLSGPINLGGEEEISINGLAQAVLNLTSSSSSIVHGTALEEDPIKRRPDLNLAKNSLGWSPLISLEEGLSRTIDFYRN